jgi:hypothetical protein
MKHFFKILLIIFCCIANNLKASSNNDFHEGYIISLKGDTTKGFLLAQISRKASENCIFKSNADSESKIYKPGEITGYRYLDGKYYVSKEIDIDSITKKVVFLEFLIKGMANIYYYADSEEHYYIEKFPNGLLELTEPERTYYQEAIPGRDGAHTYIVPSKAKGKLTYMLRDCPSINNEIQNTRLTHKSLIKLTKDYHEKMCSSESCIIYEKGNTSTKVKFGLLMGFSKNKYDFGGQCNSNYGNNYQIGAALKVSNIFMFNEHLNLKANLIFEKDSKSYALSLSDGIHNYPITYNNVRYILNDIDYGGGASIPVLPSIKTNLNVIDLKIPISLNYDFNISGNTIYAFGIGISNKVILSQNKNFQVDEFYKRYGRSINSLLTGVIATTGIEGNWFGKPTYFINASYEYLLDFKSRQDNTLKLYNYQLSIQAGVYF